MTPLLFVAAAHALCILRQEATKDGADIEVEARTEPLPCRTMTLESSTPGVTVKGWIVTRDGRKRRLKKDHVVAFDGGVAIGAPELVDGDTLHLQAKIPGSDLLVTIGPRAELPPPEQTHVTRRVALDPKHPGWGFADPTLASTVTETHTIHPDGARTWTDKGAKAQDIVKVAPGSFTLFVPEADVDFTVSPGVTESRDNGGWRFDAPQGGEVRYIVRAAGLDLVIPDQRTWLAGTDSYFAAASLPEPAVPMALLPLRDKGEIANALYDEVMDLRDGVLPGTNPLRPRGLNHAWRSGWATAVERGLILHRLLLQEKITAEWALTGQAPDPRTLTGFDTMLLRIKLGADWTWVDPTCVSCAIGELSPRWMGKDAVGAVDRIPKLPGTLTRTLVITGDRFKAKFVATGAAAVWLREVNGGALPEHRGAALAAAVGMGGGTLGSFDGLDQFGANVTIEVEGGDPPKDPFPDGTPWDGGWKDGG